MDIYACHGVAGIVGLVFTGVFAQASIAATDGYTVIDGGWLDGNYIQVGKQLAYVCACWGWSVPFAELTILLEGPRLTLSFLLSKQDFRRFLHSHVPHQLGPWLQVPNRRGRRDHRCRRGRGESAPQTPGYHANPRTDIAPFIFKPSSESLPMISCTFAGKSTRLKVSLVSRRPTLNLPLSDLTPSSKSEMEESLEKEQRTPEKPRTEQRHLMKISEKSLTTTQKGLKVENTTKKRSKVNKLLVFLMSLNRSLLFSSSFRP